MTLRQQHQAGQNKDLLLKKVNPTAATGVSRVKAGEPLAHENLRRPYLLDGAVISEMWPGFRGLLRSKSVSATARSRLFGPAVAVTAPQAVSRFIGSASMFSEREVRNL